MQPDRVASGRTTKLLAAVVWLAVAPAACWFLAFRIRFAIGVTGQALVVALALPPVVVGLVGLTLGWRLRAVALAFAALLVASGLALTTLALIARGM